MWQENFNQLKWLRTIKCGDVLVARRIKQGNKTILQLTGKGYHRPTVKT